MPQSIESSVEPGRPRPVDERPLKHVRLKVVVAGENRVHAR